MNGIYYIENSINERCVAIKGYFPTLEDAKKALKFCNDWYRPQGTGCIYFKEFGLNKPCKIVFKK